MALQGTVEFTHKLTQKNKPYLLVKVGGVNAGSLFDLSKLGEVKTGDYVDCDFEQKGSFRNVLSISKINSPTTKNEDPGPTKSYEAPVPSVALGYALITTEEEKQKRIARVEALKIATTLTNAHQESKDSGKLTARKRAEFAVGLADELVNWVYGNGFVKEGTGEKVE